MHPALARTVLESRGAIRRQILHLAWPVIAEQLLTTLANIVDAALVGRLGAAPMAAVTITQPVTWLMIGLFLGMGVGVNALVARFYGAGEHDRLEAGTRAGFWLGLTLAIAAGGLIYAFAPSILTILGAEPEVASRGVTFLRLLVPGLIATFWTLVMSAALRATGDTRTPMIINLSINAINAPLAFILIYGPLGAPALGLAGAGIATSTARILGALALLTILLRRQNGARLYLRTLHHLDWDLLRRILRVGWVASSERMFSSLIYILYARMVNTLGTVPVAAHGITVVAENVSWMLASGFSLATAAMVGQQLGAQRPDRAEAVIREAAGMGMAALGLLGLLFIAVPGPYVALFTGDAAVRALSASVLRIAGFTEIPTALVLVLSGALSGAGDTRPLFFVTTAGGIARLGMAALFLFGFGWGLQGAWMAAGCDWLVRSALVYLRFRTGAWKRITV